MNEAIRKRVKDLCLKENAFTVYNFMELESIEEDRVVYRMEIRPESCNPYGMVHGGAMYTLADDAAGTAAHTDGRNYVTQSGQLNFLSNRAMGVIRATGTIRHRGRSTALAIVDITSEDGALLATGEFTFFCIDRDRMEKHLQKA